MKMFIASLFCLLLPLALFAQDRDFAAVVEAFEKATKAKLICSCYRCSLCDCTYSHECATTKLPVPKNDFKHDCGCPLLQCNCQGACHCSENRVENRQPARWVQDTDDGIWRLYRGNRVIGAINSKGTYYPYDEDRGLWGLPTERPQAPVSQSQVIQQPAALLRGTSGGFGGACRT